MAQKAAGILRTTAKKLLENLVQRAQEVNDNPDFVYSVARIAVFGSYINTDKEKLGDLDTAVELVPRYEGDDLVDAVMEAFRQRGPADCIFIDRISFPFHEVKRYLRNRSKCLSLHDFSELERLNTDYVVIYEQTGQSFSSADESQTAPNSLTTKH